MTAGAARGAEPVAVPTRWAVLAVVLTASFLVFLDTGLLLVAIPAIQQDLDAGAGQVALAVAVYQVAFGVSVVPGGRAGDLWGRRRVLVLGVAGFVLASAACGLAASAAMLTVSRAVQGLAGALIMPQAAAWVQVAMPPEERPRAFAITGATVGTAAITGPVVGGLAVGLDPAGLGWRAAFLLNVPVGLAVLVAVLRRFPADRAVFGRVRLDLGGSALLGLALTLLLYPLLTGREAGWPWWSIVAPIASVPVLLAFWLLERRRAKTDRSPLVPPRLMAERTFRGSIVVYLLLFGGAAGFGFVLMLYVQHGLGMTALQASAVVAASPVGSLVAMYGSRRADRLFGDRTLQVGLWTVTLSTLVLLVQGSLLRQPADGYWLLPATALSGLGFGLVTPRLMALAVRDVDRSYAGAASGVLSSVQTASRAMGVAVAGALFLTVAAHAIAGSAETAGLPAGTAQCVAERVDRGNGADARQACGSAADRAAVDQSVREAFTRGYMITFGLVVGLFLVAVALAARYERGPRGPDGTRGRPAGGAATTWTAGREREDAA